MPRLAVVFALALAAPLAAQQVFRSGVELVHLQVVVSDKHGIVSGLEPADFQVFEDGKPQTISFFAQGSTREAVPMHLGLLLDRSGSMEQDLKSAANAVVKFITAYDEPVDVTFVDFDTTVSVGRFTPPSYPQLFERIRSRKVGGYTALYDALGSYLETALHRQGQHVLLLYTDGGDSTSRMTFGKLTDLLRLANVVVYSVGYLENQGSARVTQQMRLTQIARETGGDAYFPGVTTDMDSIYKKILAELAGRYTVGYTPTASKADGKFRKIDVKVVRPDLRDLKVRTRSGYLRK